MNLNYKNFVEYMCPNDPFFNPYEIGLQGEIVSKNTAIYVGGFCVKK
jgi:hypothetical protein